MCLLLFLIGCSPSGDAIRVDLLAGTLNGRTFSNYTLDDITTSFGVPDYQEEERYLSFEQETLGARLDYAKYGVTFWFAPSGTDPDCHLVEISLQLESSDCFPITYAGGLNPAGTAITKQKEIIASLKRAGVDINKAVINERIVNLTFQNHWVRWFFKPPSGFLYGITMCAERM
jgi:hypothetical protein